MFISRLGTVIAAPARRALRSLPVQCAILFIGAVQADALQAQDLLEMERPIAAGKSLWLEELTTLEIRDRIAGGYTTVIVPTGGIEQNGPYLSTGKHNLIVEGLCPAIAIELGNALCAPVVKFAPVDTFDPSSEAVRYPGTIRVRDATYVTLLDDISSSLRQAGFLDIVLIGDSGGNQRGMNAVAELLNERWKNEDARVHFVREFYTPGWEETERHTEEVLGVSEGDRDGYHDDIWVTAMMAVTDPEQIRYRERVDAGLASINGVDLTPLDATVDLGRKMIEFRARYTAAAIRKAIGP